MESNDRELANNISDNRANWHKIRNSAYSPVNSQVQYRHNFPHPYLINGNQTPPNTNETKSQNEIEYIQKPSSSPTPMLFKPSLSPVPPKMLPYLLKDPEILTKHIMRNNYLRPGLYQIVRPAPHSQYWRPI